MFYQTEAKPQGWRTVAVFDDERAECLLYLGRSSTQVRAGYAEAFVEVLDEEEREHVQSIDLQALARGSRRRAMGPSDRSESAGPG